MKDIKDVIIKILIENKSIIIDEVIKDEQCNRCKITANNFYKNTSICMNCKETENRTWSIFDENES